VSKILCKQIFELDKTIRFVGVANMEGKMIAQEYRKLLRSLLTIVESELSTAINHQIENKKSARSKAW
jgi:hypothetical protein